MPKSTRKTNTNERTLMVLIVVLLIFLSPMSHFWAALNAPWFSPYLAWAFTIFLSWLLQHHLKESDHK